MSVHYKFKSSLDFDTVTFDGLHISVSDLKKSILQQKKIGKAADFDLQITNAQTKEARQPVVGRRSWPRTVGAPLRTADLVNAKATEEDKIKAMMTQSSQEYDPSNEAYKEVKKEKPPFVKEPTPEPTQEPQLPDELLCMICRDLLQDAVLIPCCGNSFCDECVRQALLDSEQHECPVCHECDISPNNLIPNRFLRTAVLNFKNETGYTRAKRAHVALPPPLSAVAGSSSPSIAGTSESSAATASASTSSAAAAASMSPAAAGSALSVPGTASGSASPVADARSPAAEEKGEAKDDGEKSSPAPTADDATEVSKEGEAADAEPTKEGGCRSPTG
ncbi:hypothetical protein HPB47_008037 [Ixodes persulcatus]|uniref:Uncharacterized protein n=1 Tax=Ixodes persulcatus TaxID=34615 RepID=A0AC60P6M7_IXOPE|nr:hypothetical protein HPB47_008037 [Ixodes persulcatus]